MKIFLWRRFLNVQSIFFKVTVWNIHWSFKKEKNSSLATEWEQKLKSSQHDELQEDKSGKYPNKMKLIWTNLFQKL